MIMTISRIETYEYKCNLCGYQWINRINGKDGSIPLRCAGCKTHNWNRMGGNITGKEKSFRASIRGMKSLYFHIYAIFGGQYCWNDKLAEEFLNINPRPTMAELQLILHPPGLILGINSRNQYARKGYVPDPQKLGYMKYDEKEYVKIIHMEAQKRLEIMKEIIQKRGSING